MVVNGIKLCSRCKRSNVKFTKDKKSKDGLHSWCKECVIEYAKIKYLKNRDKIIERVKKRYELKKDEILLYVRVWHKKNRNYLNEYCVRKRKENPIKRLILNQRTRVSKAFRRMGFSKSNSTREILGAEWDVVRNHIEKQFKENMSWENYGEWVIDHIIPLSSAKTEEELLRFCHYTNLQPLWWLENNKKFNKILK